LSCDYLTTI